MSSVGGRSAGDGELPEALRAQIEEEMVRRDVDFSGEDLGDAGAVFVAEKLRGNTVVEELRLLHCGIGAAGERKVPKPPMTRNA